MYWQNIVGGELSKISAPIKIYKRKLGKIEETILIVGVECDSSSVKIHFRQAIIIERISIYFGRRAVDKIRTVVTPSAKS
jgi:hypothetical protein